MIKLINEGSIPYVDKMVTFQTQSNLEGDIDRGMISPSRERSMPEGVNVAMP